MENENTVLNNDVINENDDRYVYIEFNGCKMSVKKYLTMKEMLSFVRLTEEYCMLNGDTIIPELKDFSIKLNIIGMYTDMNVGTDLQKDYDLIYSTDIVDLIVKNINKNQLDSIIKSIEFKFNNYIENRYTELKNDVQDLKNMIDKVVGSIEKSLSDVNVEDLYKVLSFAKDGNFEEILSKAILDKNMKE